MATGYYVTNHLDPFQISKAVWENTGTFACRAFYSSKAQLIYGFTAAMETKLTVLRSCSNLEVPDGGKITVDSAPADGEIATLVCNDGYYSTKNYSS